MVPECFEAGNLEVVSSSVSDIVNFVASSENGTTFSLDIIRYTSADYLSGTQFEKDTENIEQYSNDQQTFYILSNVDTITATWSDGLIVEQITGNISDEYMKKIIDSIGGYNLKSNLRIILAIVMLLPPMAMLPP